MILVEFYEMLFKNSWCILEILDVFLKFAVYFKNILGSMNEENVIKSFVLIGLFKVECRQVISLEPKRAPRIVFP